jgi:predicted secreted protein
MELKMNWKLALEMGVNMHPALASFSALLLFAPLMDARATIGVPSGLISVATGEKFSLKLESNPSTGYQWQLLQPYDPGLITLLGKGCMVNPSPHPTLGSGTTDIWNFKAIGKGKTEIRLKYVRPWEKGVLPVKTMTIPVTVR